MTRHTTHRMSAAIAVGFCAALLSAPAMAQGVTPFGGFKHDASQPLEVSADSLEVRRSDQVAVYRGSVDVRQGKVRMSAERIEVAFLSGAERKETGGDAVRSLLATGGVLISNGVETAEAQRANYDVARGVIHLTGDVMLVQGENVVSGDSLTIDLATGVGKLGGRVGASGSTGRVRTLISPSSGAK